MSEVFSQPSLSGTQTSTKLGLESTIYSYVQQEKLIMDTAMSHTPTCSRKSLQEVLLHWSIVCLLGKMRLGKLKAGNRTRVLDLSQPPTYHCFNPKVTEMWINPKPQHAFLKTPSGVAFPF